MTHTRIHFPQIIQSVTAKLIAKWCSRCSRCFKCFTRFKCFISLLDQKIGPNRNKIRVFQVFQVFRVFHKERVFVFVLVFVRLVFQVFQAKEPPNQVRSTTNLQIPVSSVSTIENGVQMAKNC